MIAAVLRGVARAHRCSRFSLPAVFQPALPLASLSVQMPGVCQQPCNRSSAPTPPIRGQERRVLDESTSSPRSDAPLATELVGDAILRGPSAPPSPARDVAAAMASGVAAMTSSSTCPMLERLSRGFDAHHGEPVGAVGAEQLVHLLAIRLASFSRSAAIVLSSTSRSGAGMSSFTTSMTRSASSFGSCSFSSGTITSSPAMTIESIDSSRTMRAERFDDFLGVVEVIVLGVALVARLRPAAHLVPLRLDAFDLLGALDGVRGEHENPRGVGVGQERGVARILVDEPRQRIEVRLVRHVTADAPESARRAATASNRLGAGAREDRHAVDGRFDAGDIFANLRRRPSRGSRARARSQDRSAAAPPAPSRRNGSK